MKKYLLIVILLAASISANAQANVSAGYVHSTLSDKDGIVTEHFGFDGVYVGIGYNVALGSNFGLNPSVTYEYLSNGSLTKFLGYTGAKWKEHYINIPIMVNYSYPFCNTVKGFISAGPTMSIDISSKLSYQGTSVSMFDSFEMAGGKYKKFDVGLGLGAGVVILNHYSINLGYDWGLLNRCDYNNEKIHRNKFHVGLSYIF